jgi:hypothetical protein
MTTATIVATSTGSWHGGPDRDRLIAAAHTVLSNCGFKSSASRVSRLVRDYERHAQGYGYDFGGFVANSVAAHGDRRRAVVAHELRRVVSYSDPTGEAAVRHVLRGQR